jgi:hypothetical protein
VVRSKRQYEQLEEKVRARQALENELLDAERRFRDEKRVRKEAEDGSSKATKRLTEATSGRLKVEEAVGDLLRAEEEIKEGEASITELRVTMQSLGTELERSKVGRCRLTL